jgi:hypothetical protein
MTACPSLTNVWKCRQGAISRRAQQYIPMLRHLVSSVDLVMLTDLGCKSIEPLSFVDLVMLTDPGRKSITIYHEP